MGKKNDNKEIERENDNYVINFLADKNNYYLGEQKVNYDKCNSIELQDIALYHVEEVTFDDKAPRKEALENVLSSMKMDGVNFIYLLIGDEYGVHFYYGVARNYSYDKPLELDIDEIGEKIMEPSIKGNFRGSKIKKVNAKDKKNITKLIKEMKYGSLLEGVPGATKEDEKFQGVERLADVMLGEQFGFMIIASAVNYDAVKEIERDIFEGYDNIVPNSKINIQLSKGTNKNTSSGITKSTSKTSGENHSVSKGESTSETEGTNYTETTGSGKSSSTQKGTSTSKGDRYDSSGSNNSATNGTNTSESTTNGTSSSLSTQKSGTESSGTNVSSTIGESGTEQKASGTQESRSTSQEYSDKKSQDWIKYFDEVILPRLDYGCGKGVFVTSTYIFSNQKTVTKRLENTAISLYSGETGNKVPLKAIDVTTNTNLKSYMENFQLAVGKFKTNIPEREKIARAALSQYVDSTKSFTLGNWITTNELALIAGLPQKEVVGLSLKEEVEFGLNYKGVEEEYRTELGSIVQSGNVLENNPVFLDSRDFDKHIFVTGVTGSGKTTTCQKILSDADMPFLVIEPAKTEYRAMIDKYDDLLVFTLGDSQGTPFRINPFEFFRHEKITSRVDMLQASIEAAFDMEAAIPQLIESSIYSCYEDYGWDISKNINTKFDDPFAPGVDAFPVLSDLIDKIIPMVEKQGFTERLRDEYIGSIKARLQSLVLGVKGDMLNVKHSIDFESLLDKKVVLELEEVRSTSEKSLIMGFILTNLIEAIKAKYYKEGRIKHITLVEEAHRLLSKFIPGENLNKKQGVETFTDMLAEIRKYGESLIIVDQIPNKLTPEILKNTNTKIVHRLFAEDDKNAIGNNIVLTEEQREFLSKLEVGRAIVFSEGFSKAIQVQIKQTTGDNSEDDNNTIDTNQAIIGIERLQPNVYKYYAEGYKTGIIPGLQYFKSKPSYQEVKHYMTYINEDKTGGKVLERLLENIGTMPTDKEMRMGLELYDEILVFGMGYKPVVDNIEELFDGLKKAIRIFSMKNICRIFALRFYSQKGKGFEKYFNRIDDTKIHNIIENFFNRILDNEDLKNSDYRKLQDSLL
ncbi:MAG: hypothetical protein K6F77_07155 [Lachnospiraceae bacterium]|nr:hypothetical protein [Lachnospiraceae bacterium]